MNKLKYFFILLLLTGAFSCSNDFADLNTDPNNPSEVPAEFLLVSAQKALADDVWDEWMNARFGLMVAQYWSQNNYTDESRWYFQEGVINNYFASYYTGALRDLEEVKNLVRAGEDYSLGLPAAYNKLAVAEILQCWLYHHMTDIWGPIPYSEALQGGENRSPGYDSQRAIYLSLLSRLEKAKADIDETATGFGDADLIYGGDMGKWKRFAASLILRTAMRMSDAEPVLAQTAVEGSWEEAFSGNEDNAYFHYLAGQPNNNPLHQDRLERGDADFCASHILVDKTLLALNDPRVHVFVDARLAGGGYSGRPFGQTPANAAAEAPEEYSQPSGAMAVAGDVPFKTTDVLAPDARMVFMNYAEVCFILAEAIERGWSVGGTASQWYATGIVASLNEWGIIDNGVIANYLGQSVVNYIAAPGDWKQKIGVQKWLALYMQGVQGWAEWRRLDFDKLEAPVDGALIDVGDSPVPLRLTYPTDEQTQNAANYAAAVGSLLGGPDRLATRLWWDVE